MRLVVVFHAIARVRAFDCSISHTQGRVGIWEEPAFLIRFHLLSHIFFLHSIYFCLEGSIFRMNLRVIGVSYLAEKLYETVVFQMLN